jgi:acyl-CoA thioesterase
MEKLTGKATTGRHGFDADIAVTPMPEGWTVDLNGRWNIAGYLNGGYLMAVVGHAAMEATGLPDPLATTATFLSPPTPGPAEVSVSVVKKGRTTSVTEVAVRQGGREHVRASVVLGDLDKMEGPTDRRAVAPAIPPPEECQRLADGPGPNSDTAPEFIRQLDVRVVPGLGWLGAARTPGGTDRIEGWIRFPDGREPDDASLLLFSDGFPPAVLDLHRAGWVPTLQMTVYIRARPAPGWLQAAFWTKTLADGLLEEDGELYDSTGRLVAQSRQLAVLMPPPPSGDAAP